MDLFLESLTFNVKLENRMCTFVSYYNIRLF
jgi:hypothetical protein